MYATWWLFSAETQLIISQDQVMSLSWIFSHYSRDPPNPLNTQLGEAGYSYNLAYVTSGVLPLI